MCWNNKCSILLAIGFCVSFAWLWFLSIWSNKLCIYFILTLNSLLYHFNSSLVFGVKWKLHPDYSPSPTDARTTPSWDGGWEALLSAGASSSPPLALHSSQLTYFNLTNIKMHFRGWERVEEISLGTSSSSPRGLGVGTSLAPSRGEVLLSDYGKRAKGSTNGMG